MLNMNAKKYSNRTHNLLSPLSFSKIGVWEQPSQGPVKTNKWVAVGVRDETGGTIREGKESEEEEGDQPTYTIDSYNPSLSPSFTKLSSSSHDTVQEEIQSNFIQCHDTKILLSNNQCKYS